jgi:hypothetical protein
MFDDKVSKYSQTCFKRKNSFKTGDFLRGSIHMKISMTRHEKGDILIQVTA